NLGATCYANSLLQTWFHDLTFRRAVYTCSPTPTSPLARLQELFGSLQLSVQPAVGPEEFVKGLKLDTKEQQDAQEFAKLFMGLLEREFGKVEGGGEDVIKRQFEGEMTYGTRCLRCNHASERSSSFLELSINL
ncbi:cysteine proteinase, partial [Atractiella rhizophila]